MARVGRISCFICERDYVARNMVRIFGDENNLKREFAISRRRDGDRPEMEVTPETRICNNCNMSINQDIQLLEANPDCSWFNVLKQASSNNCIVCNAQDNVHRLTLKCRATIFVKRNIYVPVRRVTCDNHLNDEGLFSENIMNELRYINRPYIIEGKELEDFMQELRKEVECSAERRYSDENSLTDNEFEKMYAMTKDQFRDLLSYCTESVHVAGGNRYVQKKDLLCFLCKLRQGLSDEFLTILYHYSSRQAASLAIAKVRQSLMGQFVHENIGFQSLSRQEYIRTHVTPFANRLYNVEPEDPKAIAYIDCTYLEIEKCSCFKALRQSYCVHKNKHLVKPSIMVSPEGYYLDIQGPYFSNAANNDARILLSQFERDVDGMREWFQPEDILILDRGYRDAIPILNRLGITTKMPHLLRPNQNQFSTQEANESRIVTKTRWIVEAGNARLKNVFKFFARKISMSHIPNLHDFLCIAGAIINKYHQRIQMPDADENLAEEILNRSEQENEVRQRVEAENLRARRGNWATLTAAHMPLFPVLNLEYLQRLTYGTYQVGLAPSYIQDTLLRGEIDDFEDQEDPDQFLEIDERTNEPGFSRFRMFSRFRNANVYHQIWIAYNTEYIENDDETTPILGYYCTCKVGSRTVGCCSHVTAVLWYLGYARNQNNVAYPSVRVLRSIQDAAMDINDIQIIDPDNNN